MTSTSSGIFKVFLYICGTFIFFLNIPFTIFLLLKVSRLVLVGDNEISDIQ